LTNISTAKLKIAMFMLCPISTEIGLLRAFAALLEATAHLVAAALEFEKARPDDPKHPGWPAGAPDSRGGKFRPKDGDEVEVAGDVWVRPRRRR
jgi:hypothetical protein